ncbi:uncharacterized protein METZ01_LOCUS401376, partial [marine metagenome]
MHVIGKSKDTLEKFFQEKTTRLFYFLLPTTSHALYLKVKT